MTGVTIDLAQNGDAALKMAQARGHDLIFMDSEMSRMLGEEATRAIRALRRDVPIYAVTAHARKRTGTAAWPRAASGHLTKTLGRVALIDALARNFATRFQASQMRYRNSPGRVVRTPDKSLNPTSQSTCNSSVQTLRHQFHSIGKPSSTTARHSQSSITHHHSVGLRDQQETTRTRSNRGAHYV